MVQIERDIYVAHMVSWPTLLQSVKTQNQSTMHHCFHWKWTYCCIFFIHYVKDNFPNLLFELMLGNLTCCCLRLCFQPLCWQYISFSIYMIYRHLLIFLFLLISFGSLPGIVHCHFQVHLTTKETILLGDFSHNVRFKMLVRVCIHEKIILMKSWFRCSYDMIYTMSNLVVACCVPDPNICKFIF